MYNAMITMYIVHTMYNVLCPLYHTCAVQKTGHYIVHIAESELCDSTTQNMMIITLELNMCTLQRRLVLHWWTQYHVNCIVHIATELYQHYAELGTLPLNCTNIMLHCAHCH